MYDAKQVIIENPHPECAVGGPFSITSVTSDNTVTVAISQEWDASILYSCAESTLNTVLYNDDYFNTTVNTTEGNQTIDSYPTSYEELIW